VVEGFEDVVRVVVGRGRGGEIGTVVEVGSDDVGCLSVDDFGSHD